MDSCLFGVSAKQQTFDPAAVAPSPEPLMVEEEPLDGEGIEVSR